MWSCWRWSSFWIAAHRSGSVLARVSWRLNMALRLVLKDRHFNTRRPMPIGWERRPRRDFRVDAITTASGRGRPPTSTASYNWPKPRIDHAKTRLPHRRRRHRDAAAGGAGGGPSGDPLAAGVELPEEPRYHLRRRGRPLEAGCRAHLWPFPDPRVCRWRTGAGAAGAR